MSSSHPDTFASMIPSNVVCIIYIREHFLLLTRVCLLRYRYVRYERIMQSPQGRGRPAHFGPLSRPWRARSAQWSICGAWHSLKGKAYDQQLSRHHFVSDDDLQAGGPHAAIMTLPPELLTSSASSCRMSGFLQECVYSASALSAVSSGSLRLRLRDEAKEPRRSALKVEVRGLLMEALTML